MSIVVLEFPEIAQGRRVCELFAFGSVYRDGGNSCLLNGLCKGGYSLAEFDRGVNGRMWVKGGVQGRSEEGPVDVFVIIQYPGCSEIWMKVDFEHYGVMVRGKGRDGLRFGGGALS